MNIKFQIWNKKSKSMSDVDNIDESNCILRQSVCCTDRKGKEWYFMDVGECNNGDRFVISCRKSHLEYYVKWLNKPCDVNRYKMLNFFNVRTATKIGNIFELGS